MNSRSNIYIEYSNEVWNWEFSQFYANYDAANDSVINHGDPFHFAYDNSTDVYSWAHRRIAYQIKHVSDLFKTIFGEENVGCLNYLNIIYGPSSTFLHGIAIAPYFNLGDYKTWSNLTTNQVLDALNMSAQIFSPDQGWSQQAPLGIHAIYAAWFNLAVYAYEGGP